MNLIAIGPCNSGLKIYKASELKFYSTLKKSWFAGNLISILDSNNQLILEIKEGGLFSSKYKINFKNKSILKKQFLIKDSLPAKSELIFEDKDKIIFTRKWIPIVNPYLKILYNENEIGKARMK